MYLKRFTRLVRRFFMLPPVRQRMLVKVVVLIVIVRGALALFPFRWVVRAVKHFATEGRNRPVATREYQELVAWGVVAAGRRLLGSRPCLPQALVTQYLFLRKGIPASLHIGVAKGEQNKLVAHAWLCSEGEVIVGGESSPQRYTELPGLEFKLRSVSLQ